MIISDANALRYFILINATHVLPALFGEVILPAWVHDAELSAPATPTPVREWLIRPPEWISRRKPSRLDDTLNARRLGRGEREAISLALQFRRSGVAPGFLTDDRLARREALVRSIPVFRTLAVLVEAASQRLESPDAIRRLEHLPQTYPGQHPFYARPVRFADALARAELAWSNHGRESP